MKSVRNVTGGSGMRRDRDWVRGDHLDMGEPGGDPSGHQPTRFKHLQGQSRPSRFLTFGSLRSLHPHRQTFQ